ncbi:MAG: DUF1326 domain-containing protein [Bryobacteraceae bacterium]
MKKLSLLLTLTFSLWAADAPWSVQLRYIEACSCNLFCPCYFGHMASHMHGGEHKCNFNNVVRVATGTHGGVNLTGLKVWMSGDLGADWGTKGQADWLVVTFEPKATKEQKDALMAILSKVYPVNWKSVQMDSSEITWQISADKKTALAKLANGKGEVRLTRFAGADSNMPTSISNLKYFGSTWNSPFELYFSDHYYKGFGKSYQLKQANGFTITVEASSDGKRVTTKKGASKVD